MGQTTFVSRHKSTYVYYGSSSLGTMIIKAFACMQAPLVCLTRVIAATLAPDTYLETTQHPSDVASLGHVKHGLQHWHAATLIFTCTVQYN